MLEADLKDSARNTQPTPAPTMPPGQQPSPAPTLPSSSPSSTPSPSGQTAWLPPSSANCQWAELTLSDDRTLDLEAAQQYPAWTKWYDTTAGWWAQAISVVQELCSSGAQPTVATCETVLGNFDTAQATHQAALDGSSSPNEPGTLAVDRYWNEEWVANYKRLFGIVDQTGCGGSGA